MKQGVLRVRGVCKAYGDNQVLQGVSFEIHEPQVVAILGPSGTGKTTLLHIIAGLEEADEGEVTIAGEDATRMATHRRGVGMVFQRPTLFPDRTVEQNIAFPLKLRRVDRSRRALAVRETAKRVELHERFFLRMPGTLSGGEEQRVALARGLVSEPRLLLLDEPLSSLDRTLREMLATKIREYQREVGIPFIYVTHHQEEALNVADTLMILNGGVIEQKGPKEEVYEHPRTPFVAEFLGSANKFVGKAVPSLDGYAEVELKDGLILRVPRRDLTFGEKVFVYVKHEDVQISRAEPATENDRLNRLETTVVDRIFKGKFTDYVLLPSGMQDKVVASTVTSAPWRIGERLVASWPIEASRCFQVEPAKPAEPEAAGVGGGGARK